MTRSRSKRNAHAGSDTTERSARSNAATGQPMSSEDSPTSAKNAEKFVVRLPRGMRRRIAEAARGYRRSMNSEIVARLEQTLSGTLPPVPGVNEPLPLLPRGERPSQSEQRELEIRLLRAFRQLSPERQQALLELLD